VPPAYIEPLSIGSRSCPPATSKLSLLRRTVQRFVSSESPSNSSERTGPVGHWSAEVTRTSTVSLLFWPVASVAVKVAV
jgi:hypothetical protein